MSMVKMKEEPQQLKIVKFYGRILKNFYWGSFRGEVLTDAIGG